MGRCVSKPGTRHADTYDTSAPAARSASGYGEPSPFAHLPPRAGREARALAAALRLANVDPHLAHYAQRVLDTVGTSQSTAEITNLDAKNIGFLANTCNARYPGLDLRPALAPAEFRAELAATHVPDWRSLCMLGTHEPHWVAIDVRTHPDGRKSLLVMESAHALNRYENGQPLIKNGYLEFIAHLEREFGAGASMAVIDVGAQKSDWECQAFSFDFALHAFLQSGFFDGLHERLHDEGRCFTGEDESEVVEGMEYIRGTKVLPPVFYRHAESRATVETVLEEQPDARHKDVSTDGDGPAETLRERVQAFRVTRGDLTYSMSIEASRMHRIREAIEYEAGRSS